ncbi:4Fe-4S dicluster domain-containing protein [Ostreibacterium oceani]|uniref:4Fe-4S ferredoxin-type domain-containing protein n=1 Tax=Ostreibacterium oceani TaxID=2654998 RepID=A0A6N7EVK3_9GAMM|nr:hypothetical protein [Ostreibacterium oceani]MPV85570.1 hypothetical protein [Ostreibacterium oceani]
MTRISDIEQHIDALSNEFGVVFLGGFVVNQADGLPTTQGQKTQGTKIQAQDTPTQDTQALLLFGNAGSSIWSAFQASREYQQAVPDPLDQWSQRIGQQFAEQLGGDCFFPFGEPRYPFIQWLKRTGAYESSALGLLIHRDYGLWSACRFACRVRTGLPVEPTMEFIAKLSATRLPKKSTRMPTLSKVAKGLCDSCPDKPCLSVCPVGAFQPHGYDYQGCTRYLIHDTANDDKRQDNNGNNVDGFNGENGENACVAYTCQARLACPVGAVYRYETAHAQFHMKQFIKSAIKANKSQ